MRRSWNEPGFLLRAARAAAIWVVLAGLSLTSVDSARGQFLGTNFVTGAADGASAASATSTAIGVTAVASGDNSTAVGAEATASGFASTALGHDSIASGAASAALGQFSLASGISSTAVACFAQATGDNSTALGFASQAWGNGATALGYNSTAAAEFSTAIGMDAMANHANSTAIGHGAFTTRADQVVLGTAANTYTAAGMTSAASTAAQSGPVQVVTTDSAGNLAAADPAALGFAGAGDLAALQSDLNQTNVGVAMAMALSGVPNILPDGANYAVSANWGGFSGESALAVGGAARLTDRLFLNGGGALGASGRPSGGGRAGLSFAW